MKPAHGCKHAKNVRAWSLARIENGEIVEAGKIVGHWSDNPNGSVCTVSIWVFNGPLVITSGHSSGHGRAGGGGYCKFSAAACAALTMLTRHEREDMPEADAAALLAQIHGIDGAGESAVESFFRSHGYTVLKSL